MADKPTEQVLNSHLCSLRKSKYEAEHSAEVAEEYVKRIGTAGKDHLAEADAIQAEINKTLKALEAIGGKETKEDFPVGISPSAMSWEQLLQEVQRVFI